MTADTPRPESSGDFAYVVGVPRAEPAPRAAPDESPTGLIMQAVSILTDERRVRPVTCTADLRLGGDESTHQVVAHPMFTSYRCTNLATGYEQSFDGMTQVRLAGGEPQPVSGSQLNPEPMVMWLVVPLNLRVWGRPNDTARMSAARREGAHLIVDLQSMTDGSSGGQLTIDTERRIAVEIDTPELTLRYRDIATDFEVF